MAAVKHTAVTVARRRVLVAAHSKFGANSFCRFAEVSDFETIVTGSELNPAEARRYEALGPSVLRQCTPSIRRLIHGAKNHTITPATTATAPMMPKYAASWAGW